MQLAHIAADAASWLVKLVFFFFSYACHEP